MRGHLGDIENDTYRLDLHWSKQCNLGPNGLWPEQCFLAHGDPTGEGRETSLQSRTGSLEYKYLPLTICWTAVHSKEFMQRDIFNYKRTIIVAVAVLRPSTVSLPPQQSPMLGQRASSHTVCSPSPLRSFLILLNVSPDGIEVFK